MPDDLALRPFTPDDADAVAALSARCFDPDPAWTPAQAASMLTAAALGGGAHATVATRGGRVVGVGGFVRAAPWLFLWPLAADDGPAAGALLDATVAAGRGPGVATARVSTRTCEPHKLAEVVARGFRRSIDFVQLARPTAPSLPAPAVAATPRRGDAIDRAAAHALHEQAFAALANTAPMAAADFAELLDGPGAWSAATSAWHDAAGACVGFVIGATAPDHGVIEAIGVDPAWRGRGLGRAMIADVLAIAAGAGVAEVRAMVASDNPASLALHGRAGFVERARKELWDLAL
ncbi:MAG: GNAT family N-acetyltransferase [Myxococcales bacterium]|nr:GNAT family N-acetyltransferase [Myxococcales bacterium]